MQCVMAGINLDNGQDNLGDGRAINLAEVEHLDKSWVYAVKRCW